MINYLEKYNNLPKDLRDKISAPHVMEAIHTMEKDYSINLAGVVMRVVVKDLRIDELPNFFVYTVGINSDKADKLIKELKKSVFSEISNYLDYINKEDQSDSKKDDADKKKIRINSDEIKIGKNNTSADFYFSIEDEDEVRRQAQDFSSLDKREQVAMQVETKIANVMGKINVIFSSEDMSHRLQGVLKTYLRGVRDRVDTKLALERKVENGGLGLDDEISDDILRIVDVINKDEAEHPGRVIKPKEFPLPEDKQVGNNDGSKNSSLKGGLDYDFGKLAKEAKPEAEEPEPEIRTDDSSDDNEKEKENKEKDEGEEKIDFGESENKEGDEDSKKQADKQDFVLDLSSDLKKDTEDVDDNDNDKSLDNKELAKKDPEPNEENDKKEELTDDTNAFSSGMIAKARNRQSASKEIKEISAKQFGDMAGKVKMEDITKVSKLGGPIEELGSMTLLDFRRINKEPDKASIKIIEMLELLEEDSFSKRMTGIKAWRKSPLNKLYLAIGQESIIKQKNIKQITEIRKKDKKDYLSQEEFNAIMELNTKLRY